MIKHYRLCRIACLSRCSIPALIAACILVFSGLAPAQDISSGNFESRGRGVSIDGIHYPDAGVQLPISFVREKKSRVGIFANYVNRVRQKRTTYGCQPDCSDAEVSLDVALYNRGRYSFSLLPGLQSLTSRNNGTSAGDGLYMGFRFAYQHSKTLGFSVGGENLLRIDESVDLGRNAFIGLSKAYFVGDNEFVRPLVVNLGLGSGAFSLFHKPMIKTGYRDDRPDTIGDPDNYDFGLVGSLSYYYSEQLSLGAEYSGYGVGFGPSVRPFKNIPLTATFYIYDALWVPSELNYDVTPNVFGNLTLSF